MWRKGLGTDEVVVLREREVRSRAGQVEMMEAHQTHSGMHHCSSGGGPPAEEINSYPMHNRFMLEHVFVYEARERTAANCSHNNNNIYFMHVCMWYSLQ